MEINEFINATNRIEKYYDKEYTEEQRKIMYERLKDISIKEYNRAINNIFETNKYLPKLVDFRNALAQPIQRTEEEFKIDFVKCNLCNGEGFVKYFKIENNGDKPIRYEYVALCTCQNGIKQKEINGWNLPSIKQIEKK